MKRIKGIITSKRGIAMELAIGVMFIAVALGILLVTNGTIQARKSQKAQAALDEKIAVMQILEDIKLEDFGDGDSVTIPTEYGYSLTVYLDETGTKIESWQKVQPAE